MYRVKVKHDRLLLVPCKHVTVYAKVHVYTGQVTFSKKPEKNTAMFNWSACRYTVTAGGTPKTS